MCFCFCSSPLIITIYVLSAAVMRYAFLLLLLFLRSFFFDVVFVYALECECECVYAHLVPFSLFVFVLLSLFVWLSIRIGQNLKWNQYEKPFGCGQERPNDKFIEKMKRVVEMKDCSVSYRIVPRTKRIESRTSSQKCNSQGTLTHEQPKKLKNEEKIHTNKPIYISRSDQPTCECQVKSSQTKSASMKNLSKEISKVNPNKHTHTHTGRRAKNTAKRQLSNCEIHVSESWSFNGNVLYSYATQEFIEASN